MGFVCHEKTISQGCPGCQPTGKQMITGLISRAFQDLIKDIKYFSRTYPNSRTFQDNC